MVVSLDHFCSFFFSGILYIPLKKKEKKISDFKESESNSDSEECDFDKGTQSWAPTAFSGV